jgi:hypothetical protein
MNFKKYGYHIIYSSIILLELIVLAIIYSKKYHVSKAELTR